eukprot:CAMPEP_0116017252 /NCGR_PEP_ID=MMETSP0321-20121206/7939_1 /TAXON_ID=163516 /ORGANISM="Leptocylindrus danicus var. danicus, Strain B650" /LENGTH=879 /DNA_ID=CAMNT_0003487413 /DNA_START=21 /DNA_END=2657 /DNA_ORIENTATION=+
MMAAIQGGFDRFRNVEKDDDDDLLVDFGERGKAPEKPKPAQKSTSLGNRFAMMNRSIKNNHRDEDQTPEEKIMTQLHRHDSNSDIDQLRLKVKMLEFSNASKEDRLAKLEQENAALNEKLKTVNNNTKLYDKIFEKGNSSSKIGVRFVPGESSSNFDLAEDNVREEIEDFAKEKKVERISVTAHQCSRHQNSTAAGAIGDKYSKFVSKMDYNTRKSKALHHPISTADILVKNKHVAMTEGAAKIMGRLLDDLNINAARKRAFDLVSDLDSTEFSYAQFTLLAVPFERMLDDQTPVSILEGDEYRYLDPYVFEATVSEDNYPVDGKPLFSADDLTIFCFPAGVKTWLYPKAAESQINKLGLVGKKADKFQIITLTDAEGNTTYGVAITEAEEMKGTLRERILPKFLNVRKRRIAAIRIVRWAKKITSQESFRNIEKRDQFKTQSMLRSSFYNDTDVIYEDDEQKKEKKMWERSALRAAAKESYNEMIKYGEEHDILVVQKCYMLLDVRKDERVLLFSALTQIINAERWENAMKFRKQKAPGHEQDQIDRRHKALEYIRNNVMLTDDQMHVAIPKEDARALKLMEEKKKGEVSMSIPIKYAQRIKYSLPLPQVDLDWGLALLMVNIGPKNLIRILQLLLLEYPILVTGKDMDEVSCTVEALAELLKPYKWSSPLLPSMSLSMIDFVSSPVPFIAGIPAKEPRIIAKHEAVIEATQTGLSLVNITNGKFFLTFNRDAQDMLLIMPRVLLETLELLAKRIKSYEWEANRENFRYFIENGLSPRLALSLRSTRDAIERYMVSLSPELNTTRDGWKELGENENGEFYFYPNKYIDPLKNEARFCQAMAHTQMFVSHVYKRKQAYDLMNNDVFKSNLARLLAKWIW